MINFKNGFMAIACLLAFANGANAKGKCGVNISIDFVESAPRDFFKIKNSSSNWEIETLSIDLKPTKGKLIFDTIDGGSGVEVFQTFKEEQGSAKSTKVIKVADGAKNLSVQFSSFSKNQTYQFSIDVDDQMTTSELGNIRVTGSEMSGAIATVKLKNNKGELATERFTFSDVSKAELKSKPCV